MLRLLHGLFSYNTPDADPFCLEQIYRKEGLSMHVDVIALTYDIRQILFKVG